MILIINIITQIILDVYTTILCLSISVSSFLQNFRKKYGWLFYHNTNNQTNFQLNTDSIKDNLDFM